MAGGGYGQNPARWGSVGRGWRRPRGSPRARFRWLEGVGRPRRAASAVPVGTGRRAASAGVRLVWARKWAAGAAPGGAREGGGGLLGLAVGLEPKLAAAALPWHRRTARSAAGWSYAPWEGQRPLYRGALRLRARGNGGEAARAGASTGRAARARVTRRLASASGRGAGSAESRGALACVPASGGYAA
jgi:hypothetical protein